jgi:acetoin utilization protein AcuB
MKPLIADHMTRQPWSVQADDSLAVSRQMMAEREIHHLPVLDGHEVVGIVTDRELALASERAQTPVDAIMAPVHCVDSSAHLDDVLDRMADHRWDAVVIASDGHIEGIFTASDAVRVLRDVLRHAA